MPYPKPPVKIGSHYASYLSVGPDPDDQKPIGDHYASYLTDDSDEQQDISLPERFIRSGLNSLTLGHIPGLAPPEAETTGEKITSTLGDVAGMAVPFVGAEKAAIMALPRLGEAVEGASLLGRAAGRTAIGGLTGAAIGAAEAPRPGESRAEQITNEALGNAVGYPVLGGLTDLGQIAVKNLATRLAARRLGRDLPDVINLRAGTGTPNIPPRRPWADVLAERDARAASGLAGLADQPAPAADPRAEELARITRLIDNSYAPPRPEGDEGIYHDLIYGQGPGYPRGPAAPPALPPTPPTKPPTLPGSGGMGVEPPAPPAPAAPSPPAPPAAPTTPLGKIGSRKSPVTLPDGTRLYRTTKAWYVSRAGGKFEAVAPGHPSFEGLQAAEPLVRSIADGTFHPPVAETPGAPPSPPTGAVPPVPAPEVPPAPPAAPASSEAPPAPPAPIEPPTLAPGVRPQPRKVGKTTYLLEGNGRTWVITRRGKKWAFSDKANPEIGGTATTIEDAANQAWQQTVAPPTGKRPRTPRVTTPTELPPPVAPAPEAPPAPAPTAPPAPAIGTAASPITMENGWKVYRDQNGWMLSLDEGRTWQVAPPHVVPAIEENAGPLLTAPKGEAVPSAAPAAPAPVPEPAPARGGFDVPAPPAREPAPAAMPGELRVGDRVETESGVPGLIASISKDGTVAIKTDMGPTAFVPKASVRRLDDGHLLDFMRPEAPGEDGPALSAMKTGEGTVGAGRGGAGLSGTAAPPESRLARPGFASVHGASSLLGGTVGAGYGATQDREHPLRGAIVGGLAGAAAGAVAPEVLSRAARALPEGAVRNRGGFAALPGKWYSRLERAIEQGPDKTTGKKWLDILRGGSSKGERKWTDIERRLLGHENESFTRDEVMQLARLHPLAPEETVLRADNAQKEYDAMLAAGAARRDAWGDLDAAFGDVAGGVLAPGVHRAVYDAFDTGARPELLARALANLARRPEEELLPIARRLIDTERAENLARARYDAASTDDVQYEQYQEPGERSNYREVLIKLPGTAYQSGHFNQAGEHGRDLALHLRLSDRTTTNPTTGSPEKALYVEEVQSDWAQAARDAGAWQHETQPKRRALQAQLAEMDGWRKNIEQEMAEAGVPWYDRLSWTREHYPDFDAKLAERGQIQKKLDALAHAPPYMPYGEESSDAAAMAWRRLLQEAADGGYDRVVWTTGEQQIERWNQMLREKVNSLAYDEAAGVLRAEPADGGPVQNIKVKPADLHLHVGNEIARRLLDAPGVVLRGDNLTIGGKGMRQHYDEIIPNVARKEAKKLGIQLDVEPVTVPGVEAPAELDWQGPQPTQAELEAALADAKQAGDGNAHYVLDVLDNMMDARSRGSSPVSELLGTPPEYATAAAAYLRNIGRLVVADPEPITHQSIPVTSALREQVKSQGTRLYSNPAGEVGRGLTGALATRGGRAAAGGALGAAIGAHADDEHPARGALAGAALGAGSMLGLERALSRAVGEAATAGAGESAAPEVARVVQSAIKEPPRGLNQPMATSGVKSAARTAIYGLSSAYFASRASDVEGENARRAEGYKLMAAWTAGMAAHHAGLTGPVERALANGWQKLAVGGAAKVADKVWELNPSVGNFFFTGHTLDAKAKEAFSLWRRSVSEGRMQAEDLLRDLQGYPKILNEVLSKAADEGFSGEELVDFIRREAPGVKDPEKAARLLETTHDIFEGLGRQLNAVGLLSDESRARYARRYLPRFYQQLEGELEGALKATRPSGSVRLRGMDRLMRRADEAPEGLTPLHDFQYRAATGIVQESYLAATENLFHVIRSNDAWTHQGVSDAVRSMEDLGRLDQLALSNIKRIRKETSQALAAATDTDRKAIATEGRKKIRKITRERERLSHEAEQAKNNLAALQREAAEKGYVQLPTSKKLGSLSGQYVRPEVANEINGIARLPVIYGDGMNAYLAALRAWKQGKTVLNPGTHFRNTVGAQLLGWMGGGPEPFHPYWGKAMQTIRANGKTSDAEWKALYRQARDAGLFDSNATSILTDRALKREGTLEGVAEDAASEFARGQGIGPRAAGAASRAKGAAGKAFHAIQEVYGNEDEAARFAYFVHAIKQRGLTADEAAGLAKKWVPVFDNLSNFSKVWGRFAAPFWAYTAKSIPLVAEAAVTNPLRFAAMGTVAAAFADIYISQQAPEEVLPSELRGPLANLPVPEGVKRAARAVVPTTLPIGSNPETGEETLADLTYMLPYGDIAEGRSRSYGPISWLPAQFNPAKGPLIGTLAALHLNKDPFSGREITRESMTLPEKLSATGDYVYKQLAPSLAPSVPGTGITGGWSWQKLSKAARQEPNPWTGDVQDLPHALMDVSVVKNRQITPSLEYGRRLREIQGEMRDLTDRLKEVYRNRAIPDPRKEEIREDFANRMQALQRQAQHIAELAPYVPGLY